jgi:hypothetical protein
MLVAPFFDFDFLKGSRKPLRKGSFLLDYRVNGGLPQPETFNPQH